MSTDAPIRLLTPDVVNKIAAGEIIERPASVLKELLENAVDAGATQIDVAIAAGGIKLISVADNGKGMDRDNALLSIERHATSKIRTAEDVECVATLGFRGEALASIAACSRFRLLTRPAEALTGTELLINGGRLQDVTDAGGPAGTIFEVRDLFFNLPARRKFMRTAPTEMAHIQQVFLVHALGHPEIGFRLTVDARPMYSLPAGAKLEDRLRELFGPELISALRPVVWRNERFTISGYAGLPAASRADRNEQYVFINRRPATAPIIAHAIREGYHTLLPAGRFPVLFIFMELDAERVDVNVHPTKREVRFREPQAIRDGLIAALRGALTTPAQLTGAGPLVSAVPAPPTPELHIDDLPSARIFHYPALPGIPIPVPPTLAKPAPGAASEPAATRTSESEAPPASPARAPWAWCRVVGQIGGLYVILETEDGFVIMDPHAAHERVLFERYLKALSGGAVISQGLLTPETVELPPRDALRARQNLTLLRRMGFGIAEFGGN
ncbi:MAG: DNA mismatch repair endonuclease MutL, partial [Kiritimatiellia bacterium]